MNDTIPPAHLQRKAMLYIWQSSVHQVRYNHRATTACGDAAAEVRTDTYLNFRLNSTVPANVGLSDASTVCSLRLRTWLCRLRSAPRPGLGRITTRHQSVLFRMEGAKAAQVGACRAGSRLPAAGKLRRCAAEKQLRPNRLFPARRWAYPDSETGPARRIYAQRLGTMGRSRGGGICYRDVFRQNALAAGH